MSKESLKNKKIRASNIAQLLEKKYSNSTTELLYWDSPFRLLIAVSLSAQTTDKSVNKVTPILWKKYPKIRDLADAELNNVENILKPLGFYKIKAKNIIKCANLIIDKFNSDVPKEMDKLQELPGVGRKTANIVLNVAFNKVEGIAVDTHVFRITHRLGLSNAKNPSKTELDLLKIFDKRFWKNINHHLVLYGREICLSNKPKCESCIFNNYCKFFKNNKKI